MTSFDFVLFIIIGEATQQALLGEDFSVSNSFVIISTLVGIDILLSEVKQRFPKIGRIIDNTPVIVFADGKLLKDRADKERVDEEDILHAARTQHGLERLDQIKYAILELSGGISIIPKH